MYLAAVSALSLLARNAVQMLFLSAAAVGSSLAAATPGSILDTRPGKLKKRITITTLVYIRHARGGRQPLSVPPWRSATGPEGNWVCEVRTGCVNRQLYICESPHKVYPEFTAELCSNRKNSPIIKVTASGGRLGKTLQSRGHALVIGLSWDHDWGRRSPPTGAARGRRWASLVAMRRQAPGAPNAAAGDPVQRGPIHKPEEGVGEGSRSRGPVDGGHSGRMLQVRSACPSRGAGGRGEGWRRQEEGAAQHSAFRQPRRTPHAGGGGCCSNCREGPRGCRKVTCCLLPLLPRALVGLQSTRTHRQSACDNTQYMRTHSQHTHAHTDTHNTHTHTRTHTHTHCNRIFRTPYPPRSAAKVTATRGAGQCS